MRIMDSVKITSLNIKNHTGYCEVEINISDTANATTLCIITRVQKRQDESIEDLQQTVVRRAQSSLRSLFDEP